MAHILHTEISGEGEDIILVSGMLGSARYWDPFIADLHAKGYRTTTIDLLGFGHSPKPRRSKYSIDDHAQALIDTLRSLDLPKPAVVAGLSMAVPVILRMHQLQSTLAKRIVLFSPMIYDNPKTAKELSSKTGGLNKVFIQGPVAWTICNTVCRVPFIAQPIYLLMDDKKLPPRVIKDAVYHTWNSYRRSFKNCMVITNGDTLMEGLTVPTLIVAGESDISIDNDFLKRMAAKYPAITLHYSRGGHQPPYEDKETCLRIMLDE